MDDVAVPPGWPPHVRPPGHPKHVSTAVVWLLEQCPANYRTHPALTSSPPVLAWLARLHVESQQAANVAARGAARAELHEVVDVRAVDQFMAVLDVEQARLYGVHRAVQLVAASLATSTT